MHNAETMQATMVVVLLLCAVVTSVEAANGDNAEDAANVAELTLESIHGEYTKQLSDLRSLVDRQQHVIDDLVTKLADLEQRDNLKASNRLASEPKATATGTGVTYIRWGRKTCSGTADAFGVYIGYAARGSWGDTEAGDTTLCMPEEPVWGNYNNDNGDASYVYAAEYIFSDVPFSTINNNNESLSYNDVPCVVCFARYQSVQIMVPGRAECPTYGNWTMEYRGYLVTNFHANSQSDYVCLDEAPEIIDGGAPSAPISSHMHPVRGTCDPFRCPPYAAGRQIPCVVCTY